MDRQEIQDKSGQGKSDTRQRSRIQSDISLEEKKLLLTTENAEKHREKSYFTWMGRMDRIKSFVAAERRRGTPRWC